MKILYTYGEVEGCVATICQPKIAKLCCEDGEILIGEGRVVEIDGAYRIITRVARLCHGCDHAEEHKQQGQNQLGDYCSLETSKVVESLQKHGNKLLKPQNNPSIGNWRERERERV